MADLELIYNISLNKLHNFQITRRDSDSLRKLVLLNNFVFKKFVSPKQEEQVVEPLEWSEEDIKKDEESWLDSCLNDLDEEEDEDGYICVNKPPEYQPTPVSFSMDRYQYYDDYYSNAMDYEQCSHERQVSDDKVTDDVIIPHDLLHLPFFEPGNMVTEEEQIDDNCTLQQEENLTCEKGFHPYWKDNSIISQSTSPLCPYFKLNTRSFSIPKIFHKYRLGQAPPFILELLHPNQSLELPHYQSSLKRSKDDLDILYSLTPRDLDKGALMDMISMLEYYGKANHDTKNSNSSEINDDIWFVDK